MIIAIANTDPQALRMLTDRVLSACPGGIIYEHGEYEQILECMRSHALDAVVRAMPRQSGPVLALLAAIRKLSPVIPVIVCAEDDSALEDAMWNGASKFLIKPLTSAMLREALAVK